MKGNEATFAMSAAPSDGEVGGRALGGFCKQSNRTTAIAPGGGAVKTNQRSRHGEAQRGSAWVAVPKLFFYPTDERDLQEKVIRTEGICWGEIFPS